MSYRTLDGFVLNAGDSCYVVVEDPAGEANLSDRPRKAFYRSEQAKAMGWDFEIPRLRFDGTVQVTQVYKYWHKDNPICICGNGYNPECFYHKPD